MNELPHTTLNVIRILGSMFLNRINLGMGEDAAIRESRDEIARAIGHLAKPGTFYAGLLAEPKIASEWAKLGFPTLSPGSRLAASLACTDIPDHEREMPWPAFVVRIPRDVLGGPIDVMIGGRMLAVLYSSGSATVGMAERGWSASMFGESPIDLAAARIALGSELEIDRAGLENVRQISSARTTSKSRGLPPLWMFQLTRPVRCDMRSAVRDYVSGKRGGKLKLQHVVRGHYKMQPCGSGRGDRKWIHVEPYWRGDESAPIALRRHEVTNAKN